jgi:hypothetical protein
MEHGVGFNPSTQSRKSSSHPISQPRFDAKLPTMASHSVQRMTLLSQEIAAKTKIITDHLTAKGLDAASFDVNGLAEFPISQDDEEPYKARLELISLTKELHDIALGPKEGLRYLAWDVSIQSLY